MSIQRTGGVPPVIAIVATGRETNDPTEDSIRKRLEHEGLAREFSERGGEGGGRTLAEMAQDPLPANVAAAIVGSTKVTISEAGRQAAALDADVAEEHPAQDLRLRAYQDMQGMKPPGKG